MTYVVSDLHGYPLEKIIKFLQKINFSETDKLYVLGDCIDRGKNGIKIIQWIMTTPNAELILGNHEAMLLENKFIFDYDEIPSAYDLVGQKKENYLLWLFNGGIATVDELQQYRSRQIENIISFLEKAPLYKDITVAGKRYILCHSGFDHFDENKLLCEYSKEELLCSRPTINTRYYGDETITIFGHTPTMIFDEQYKGKPIITDTWIDIDMGVYLGEAPLLLRLDDMEEFYIR